MQLSFVQKSILVALGAVAMMGSTAIGSQAAIIIKNEVNDAGALVPNAQDLSTLSATDTTRVRGEIFDKFDADLYKFTISTLSDFTARVFPRTTSNNNDPINDSQLFLFDSAGKALKANDNINALNAFSRISTVLAAGTYFLGISSFDLDPRNSANQFLFANGATGLLNPRSAVAGNPGLANWATRTTRPDTAGLYRIDLTAEAVPTPALLPGLAALGFSAIRKRKEKAAV